MVKTYTMSKKNMPEGNVSNQASLLLKDHQGDITKRWYIYETAPGCKEKKHYCGINKGKTVEERYQLARIAMRLLAEQLKTDNATLPRRYMPLMKTLDLHKPNLRIKSYRTLKSKIGIAEDWLQANNVRAFNPDLAAKFIRHLQVDKQLNPTTVKAYFNTFRLIYKKRKEKNPFLDIQQPSARHTPSMYYSNSQAREVTEAIAEYSPNLFTFIHFIYYCFIRPGELADIKVGDIQLEKGIITVRAEISKTKKTESVTIPRQLYPIIEAMKLHKYPTTHYAFSTQGEPHFEKTKYDYFSRIHRSILVRLGYDTTRYKLYSWKHTGAVAWIKAGGNVKALQSQMRHSTLEMTDRYLRSLGLGDFEEQLLSFPKLGGQ
jgi:integrase